MQVKSNLNKKVEKYFEKLNNNQRHLAYLNIGSNEADFTYNTVTIRMNVSVEKWIVLT